MVGVGLGIVLIAEDSEREEGDVDVAGIKDRVDEFGVRTGVLGVEVDSGHSGDPDSGERSDGLVTRR